MEKLLNIECRRWTSVILMLKELWEVTPAHLELDHVWGIACLYAANDISFHNINRRLDVVLRLSPNELERG